MVRNARPKLTGLSRMTCRRRDDLALTDRFRSIYYYYYYYYYWQTYFPEFLFFLILGELIFTYFAPINGKFVFNKCFVSDLIDRSPIEDTHRLKEDIKTELSKVRLVSWYLKSHVYRNLKMNPNNQKSPEKGNNVDNFSYRMQETPSKGWEIRKMQWR